MSDEVERDSQHVPVEYHHFDISDEDGPTGLDLDRTHNGLVRTADGVTIVSTGIHTGYVDVTVSLHEAEPSPDDGNWQEIVEISAHSAAGTPPSTSHPTKSPSGPPGVRVFHE
ncbi:hypothetical protein ACFZDJ_51580 [Streptomyces sp. NPDC007896]|uniref:hypothetical protein n=1 Tax=Streptomyces sp. NPDC007896 TaxID=3364784 RepID=UPI0036EB3A39